MTAAVRSFSPEFSVRLLILVKLERRTLTTIPGEVLVPKYARSFTASITAEPRLFSPLFRVIDVANADTGTDDAMVRTNEKIAIAATVSFLRPGLCGRGDIGCNQYDCPLIRLESCLRCCLSTGSRKFGLESLCPSSRRNKATLGHRSSS